MTNQQPIFFNQQKVALRRMEAFHRDRVQAISNGSTVLKKGNDGILVVHMIPVSCVLERKRFEAMQLKEHGKHIPPPGRRRSYSRFNVDGFMNYDNRQSMGSYSQLYRDGRLEAALSDAACPLDRHDENGERVLRDAVIEEALSSLIQSYLQFCKATRIQTPIWLFSALAGCEGVRACVNWNFCDVSDDAVDRSPCHLPELEITSLDADTTAVFRSRCDLLWQACGLERSFNFDESGNWRDRRR